MATTKAQFSNHKTKYATSLPAQSDYGTPERHLKGGDIVEELTERAGIRRARVTIETALDWYYANNNLDKGPERNKLLYDCGVRFRKDWTVSGLEPNVIGRYSDMVSAGSIQGLSGMREDAYKRWRAAILAVGPIASMEVIKVCCIGERVGRTGLEILRRGLGELASHYGKI